jgi:hypothetical protein
VRVRVRVRVRAHLGKRGDEGAGVVCGRDGAEQVAELHEGVGSQQLLLVASVPREHQREQAERPAEHGVSPG